MTNSRITPLILLVGALPIAARAQVDLSKACLNERRLLCPGIEENSPLKDCLSQYRRSLMPDCKAALEGKPPPAPPPPAPPPDPAPAPKVIGDTTKVGVMGDTTKVVSPTQAELKAQTAAAKTQTSSAPTPEQRQMAAKSFLNVDLPKADGSGFLWMAGCPTEKCLTVFLAPWCGYCRKATPAIKALRAHLAGRGVETRIVIGKDEPPALKEYAADFGPETIIDLEGEFRFSGGVPHFFVSREGGEVLLDRAGMRHDETPEQAAARFKLP